MEPKRFGARCRLILPLPLGEECEVMRFDREGTPHTHVHVAETAIAVSGSGAVIIEGERHPIAEGQFVVIPAGRQHHMVPDEGVSLAMLVGYTLTHQEKR